MNKKTKKIIAAVAFAPLLAGMLYGYYLFKTYRIQNKRAAIERHNGLAFPSLPVVDTNGHPVSLPVAEQEYTIIDFWFKNCPGCISEMQAFESMLKGKEKKVRIISISTDNFDDWRKLITGTDMRFDFIKNLPNWYHYALKANTQESSLQSNSIYLSAQLNITGYPSYFVLGKDNIIRATPKSAVHFMKETFNGENRFTLFITSPATWKSYQPWLALLVFITFYFVTVRFFLTKNDRHS